jgi:hypothetical protein
MQASVILAAPETVCRNLTDQLRQGDGPTLKRNTYNGYCKAAERTNVKGRGDAMRSESSKAWACGMLIAVLGAWAVPGSVNAHAADAELAARCAQIGNDDRVRPYDPSLSAGLIKAYSRLSPGARMPPPAELKAGANIRCMNGHLLACFVGANLPCGKMQAARDNPGADEYCHGNPDADVVPAFATGHDTTYSYRCASGKPVVVGQTFTLDRRGFAAKLWAPVD